MSWFGKVAKPVVITIGTGVCAAAGFELVKRRTASERSPRISTAIRSAGQRLLVGLGFGARVAEPAVVPEPSERYDDQPVLRQATSRGGGGAPNAKVEHALETGPDALDGGAQGVALAWLEQTPRQLEPSDPTSLTDGPRVDSAEEQGRLPPPNAPVEKRSRHRLSTSVSDFSALSAAVDSDAEINIVNDITSTAYITISAKTNLNIFSDTRAVLDAQRSSSHFRIGSGSEVTFRGLVRHNLLVHTERSQPNLVPHPRIF